MEQLAVCAGEIQQQDYRYNNTHMTPAPPLPSPPIPCNSPVSRAGGGDVDSDVGYRGVYHGGYGCDQEGLVIEAAVFMEQEDILRPGVDLPVSMEVEGEGEKDGEGRRASCTAIDRGVSYAAAGANDYRCKVCTILSGLPRALYVCKKAVRGLVTFGSACRWLAISGN